MELFTVLIIIVVVLIVLGILLDKINWVDGVKLLIIVAVIGILIYYLITRFLT